MEGRNVGTITGKSRKQGLISAKDLPMELPEGCESPKLGKIITLPEVIYICEISQDI